jgi:uncharacterized phage protein (TIGR02220 family)
MARTHYKVGLEYFTHDTDAIHDPKLRALRIEYKLVGYAVFMITLEELYRNRGYYAVYSERSKQLFCFEHGISEEDYSGIINICLDEGLFDRRKFEEYGILTSERIQYNYLDGTIRRKSIELIEEYLIADLEDVANVELVSIKEKAAAKAPITPKKRPKAIKEEVTVDNSREDTEDTEELETDIIEEDNGEEELVEIKETVKPKDVINYLNKKLGTKYQVTQGVIKKINARINECKEDPLVLDDFLNVIDKRYDSWKGTNYEQYLRPETLFGTKFQGYLNATKIKKTSGNIYKDKLGELDDE